MLISRIFGEKAAIFSLGSRNYYGEHSFGTLNVCFTHSGLSRSQAYSNVANRSPAEHPAGPLRSILSRPRSPPRCEANLRCSGAYIMDDNNVASRGIPDDLMAELLENSALRLAISPELREAYQEKYRLKFWLLPPVVAPEAISVTANDPKRGPETQNAAS